MKSCYNLYFFSEKKNFFGLENIENTNCLIAVLVVVFFFLLYNLGKRPWGIFLSLFFF